jgi:predicted Zn-dependent protease
VNICFIKNKPVPKGPVYFFCFLQQDMACYFQFSFKRIYMRKILFTVLPFVVVMSCTSNKITGRKQMSIISNAQLISLAETEYAAVLEKSKVITNTKASSAVNAIGKRIVEAVNKYYASQGLQNLLKGYTWEYNLIESKDANAWCLPGGKIAVYSGLLPITENDNALAIIIGHEVAHALAEHGKERVNQQIINAGGALTLQVLIANESPANQAMFMQAFGVVTEYGVVLPFSRKQELEADKLGLKFSAMAGYNPAMAISLWQRMGAIGKGAQPPEFASTHPSEETRINELKKILPEVITIYEASNKTNMPQK